VSVRSLKRFKCFWEKLVFTQFIWCLVNVLDKELYFHRRFVILYRINSIKHFSFAIKKPTIFGVLLRIKFNTLTSGYNIVISKYSPKNIDLHKKCVMPESRSRMPFIHTSEAGDGSGASWRDYSDIIIGER